MIVSRMWRLLNTRLFKPLCGNEAFVTLTNGQPVTGSTFLMKSFPCFSTITPSSSSTWLPDTNPAESAREDHSASQHSLGAMTQKPYAQGLISLPTSNLVQSGP